MKEICHICSSWIITIFKLEKAIITQKWLINFINVHMTLFATILTSHRETQWGGTPDIHLLDLHPLLHFFLSSTAQLLFQRKPTDDLAWSSKRHWLHLQTAQLQNLGKASTSTIYVSLVLTKPSSVLSQSLNLPWHSKLSILEVGLVLFGFFPHTCLETRTRVMLAWKFYWQLFGPNTQNSTWATKESVQTK